MTYVISDLHGLELSKLQAILTKANFCDNDFLYILGDVIDRQNDGGVEILEWLLSQKNVQLILGNHEEMLLSCEFIFDKITDESIENVYGENAMLLNNYMYNGGEVTLKSLSKLTKKSPQAFSNIISYLKECPLYKAITINNQDFILVHSGFGNFDKNKKISDYDIDELVWTRPELTDEYFSDIITVFGHTPTLLFDNKYKGKFIKTKTWIDIDVGIPFGNKPRLLCLDNMKEISL